MKRIALILTVTAGLILAGGVIETVSNYKWKAGDQNAFFGNSKVLLDDGATMLIAGLFLGVVAAVTWYLASRKGHGDQQRS
ncbi:MAG: hypothetical protein ACR2FU_20165 [Streptosporangiaceae bacterium]